MWGKPTGKAVPLPKSVRSPTAKQTLPCSPVTLAFGTGCLSQHTLPPVATGNTQNLVPWSQKYSFSGPPGPSKATETVESSGASS